MRLFSCTVPGPRDCCYGVASRALPARPGEAAATQTLVTCGRELRPLIGAGGHSGLELGPPLQLYAEPAADDGGEPAAARRPYVPSAHGLSCPVWDPYSGVVYMRDGTAVVRLGSDDTVTVVAGDGAEEGDTDGPGRAARFAKATFQVKGVVVADGAGSLYVADKDRIRKVQLASGQGPQPQPAGEGGAGAAAPTAAADGEVLVSTLPFQAPDSIQGLAFDGGAGSGTGGGSGSLLFATSTALYRLPLGDPTAAPVLWVGSEGWAPADGRTGGGAVARFTDVHGIALDGSGAVYAPDWVTEDQVHVSGTALRRIAPGGTVTTALDSDLGDQVHLLAILPNGCLAACSEDGLQALLLGLPLPRWHAAAPPPPPAAADGPPPRTLPPTADVRIVVGGRTFHAHRGLLCARSDYFKHCLGGGFADFVAQQLTLPDADPDAFEVVLDDMYTDAAEIPAALAQAVAELADRLLLPELCARAAAAVEASVSAGTVVGLLLWAEARGPIFSALLARLKAWYVENHEAVMREAGEEVKLLEAQSPELMSDLSHDLRSWLTKRPRAS